MLVDYQPGVGWYNLVTLIFLFLVGTKTISIIHFDTEPLSYIELLSVLYRLAGPVTPGEQLLLFWKV